MQPEGKQHLCLRPGRPHQLVQLPGHCFGQLCGECGQRRGIYRRGKLPELHPVFQRELHPQAVRLETQRLPDEQCAVPGRGGEGGGQPVRDRGDTVLSFTGRSDGVERQPACKGERRTGHRKADGGGLGDGRAAGCTVLPLPAPESGRRRQRAAAGVRHREGAVARGKPSGHRNGEHRAAAVPVGRQRLMGGRL